MIELNESNFKEETSKHPQLLVMFYREKGCSFCDKMKPVFEAHNAPYVKAIYKLGGQPDSITEGLVERFPTFGAYAFGELVGKQEGVLNEEQLKDTFNAPKKQLKVEQAPLSVLKNDEMNLIDQIYGLKKHLLDIQKEIRLREEIVNG